MLLSVETCILVLAISVVQGAVDRDTGLVCCISIQLYVGRCMSHANFRLNIWSYDHNQHVPACDHADGKATVRYSQTFKHQCQTVHIKYGATRALQVA